MRRIALIITTAFVAGLFAVAQGWGGGEYGHGKTSDVGSAGMEETREPATVGYSLDNSQVRELQRILTDKGFDAGAVDGIIGPNTSNAIREFQQAEGLAVSGNPNEETLRALAPDAETQEFFGLSPEFGEKGMEPKKPEESKGAPEGTTKPMERY